MAHKIYYSILRPFGASTIDLAATIIIFLVLTKFYSFICYNISQYLYRLTQLKTDYVIATDIVQADFDFLYQLSTIKAINSKGSSYKIAIYPQKPKNLLSDKQRPSFYIVQNPHLLENISLLPLDEITLKINLASKYNSQSIALVTCAQRPYYLAIPQSADNAVLGRNIILDIATLCLASEV